MNTPLDNPTENFECKCDDAYHVKGAQTIFCPEKLKKGQN